MIKVIPKGSVVVIDTLAQAALGLDENTSEGMGRIVSGAKRIRQATGGLVLLVHHSGKDQTKGGRGHSSLKGALDIELGVFRDESTLERSWQITKNKDGEDSSAYSFDLRVVQVGVNTDGDPIKSCVVVPGEAVTPTGPGKKGRPNEADAAVSLYLVAQPAGVRKSQVVAALAGKVSRSPVYAALNRLIDSGQVHESTGLVAASTELRAEYARL
jgi:hypothetical protein